MRNKSKRATSSARDVTRDRSPRREPPAPIRVNSPPPRRMVPESSMPVPIPAPMGREYQETHYDPVTNATTTTVYHSRPMVGPPEPRLGFSPSRISPSRKPILRM